MLIERSVKKKTNLRLCWYTLEISVFNNRVTKRKERAKNRIVLLIIAKVWKTLDDVKILLSIVPSRSPT